MKSLHLGKKKHTSLFKEEKSKIINKSKIAPRLNIKIEKLICGSLIEHGTLADFVSSLVSTVMLFLWKRTLSFLLFDCTNIDKINE